MQKIKLGECAIIDLFKADYHFKENKDFIRLYHNDEHVLTIYKHAITQKLELVDN